MSTDFPLYNLVLGHQHPPITLMQAYLRDDGRSWEEVEARRKDALRNHLATLKAGAHPVPVVLEALEDILGPRHPLRHLSDLVKDQDSFRRLFMPKPDPDDKTPQMTEAEFQHARKAHIEKLIRDNFRDWHRASKQVAGFSDDLIARLDNPNEGSLDIARRFFGFFVLHHYMPYESEPSTEYGFGAIGHALDRMMEDENFDNSVHPNDAHIEGDLLDVLRTYEPRTSFEESRTRDAYQTQEDIELRRANEIVGILEKWKAGAHPLHVITDILDVALGKHDTDLEYMAISAKTCQQRIARGKADHIRATPEEMAANEDDYVHSLLEEKDLRRKTQKVLHAMREEIVAYRGPATHPEFAAQIDAFIDHLLQTDEASLSIVQGVAEAMFSPVDDAPYINNKEGENLPLRDAPLLTRIREQLREKQKEEDARFEKQRPMGKFETETEAHAKDRLKDTFARRAAPAATPVLITGMQIDATGSGMIKPFPDIGEDSFEEDIYGTTTARITTYSVSLMPQDPSQMPTLAARVKTALEEIADTPYAFGIPFDLTARDEAYKRPVRRRKWGEKDPITYDHTYVKVYDDRVQVMTWLDLDDVWNLYYLLEDIIQPNAQIAAAMDGARRAEERGVLLRKEDMNAYYSNSSMKPEEQMGSLDDVSAEDFVPKTMEDTLKLYALGEINEEQLLQRTLVLADHTLTGRMLDPVGLLPTFNRLTDQSGATIHAGAVITYDEALRERTRAILQIMTGTYGEDRPLFPALIKKVADISKPLRDKLRADALNEEIAFHERMMQELRGGPKNPFEDLFIKPDQKDGPDTKVKFASPSLTEEERKNRANIARTANIALRGSDVGLTSDRTWHDTAYVSRSKNSLWVRKDLPAALKPFVKPAQRPDMRDALKLLGR